jgi:hypothetical protein
VGGEIDAGVSGACGSPRSIESSFFVSRSIARTDPDPACYHCNPIPACRDDVVTRSHENLRSLFRKQKGTTAMEGPRPSIPKRPARHRRARSSLVRKLVQAKDDPAKQRIRRWLSDISDERLLNLGLTPEDIAVVRGSRGNGNVVYLLLMCALSVPSPPGSWF